MCNFYCRRIAYKWVHYFYLEHHYTKISIFKMRDCPKLLQIRLHTVACRQYLCTISHVTVIKLVTYICKYVGAWEKGAIDSF